MRKAAVLLGVTALWILAAFVSIWIIAESPFDFPHFLEAVVGGTVGSFLFNVFEHSSFVINRKRKLSTLQLLFERSLGYTTLITLSILIIFIFHNYVYGDTSPNAAWISNLFSFFTSLNFFVLLIILLVASFFISFMREVVRMLGPGVLTKLLLGNYNRPIEEERIFMFLDLNDSTTLAETLGALRFTEFKNDFFFDIADPIIKNRGEVFQYVGDEAVLTWKYIDGIKNSNWLKCFFEIKKAIKNNEHKYLAKFGTVPKFKAGCHCGKVITKEVGDIKRNIVHSGDAVNTASRIKDECRKFNRDILLSEDLYSGTVIPDDLVSIEIGNILLKGKAAQLNLWSIEENNIQK